MQVNPFLMFVLVVVLYAVIVFVAACVILSLAIKVFRNTNERMKGRKGKEDGGNSH